MNLKQRTKGGTWYVHFDGPNGERYRLSTETKDHTVAQIEAARIVREKLVDQITDETRAELGDMQSLSDMLTAAWHKRWKGKKSADAARARIGRLARDIGHWPRSMVTYGRLEAYLDGLTVGKKNPTPLSPAGKNRYVSLIHTAMTVASTVDSTLVVPKLPHWTENNFRERYVSAEEEARIVKYFATQVAPHDENKQYLSRAFLVLIDTGMRCGEALEQMTAASIQRDPSGRAQAVHLKHGDTKSGRGRMVPLTVRAAAAVEAMLVSPLHGTWTSQNAGRQWRTVMGALGIEGVNLHTLRHTTASRLVQAGVDLYQVSIWLGHSSMEVTRRYAHFAPDTLKGALRALEEATNPATTPDSPVYSVGEAHPVHTGTQNRQKLYAIK